MAAKVVVKMSMVLQMGAYCAAMSAPHDERVILVLIHALNTIFCG